MAWTWTATDPNLKWYLALAFFGVALTVGVVWVHRVWSDVKGEADESPARPQELLAPLAEAFAAGQMTEEEYLRIRDSVSRGVPSGRIPPRDASRPDPVRARPAPASGLEANGSAAPDDPA